VTVAGPFDNARLLGIADALAIAVALSLPWSTSATVILVILWALSLIAMFDLRALRETVMTPAGGLPVLLVLLGALGMAWADVNAMARLDGADSYLKLLAIPLLLIQFQRSERGLWVLGAFVLSCTVLLVATALIMLVPPLSEALVRPDNVIVKNAASQSGEFVLCVFGLAYVAVDAAERRQWRWFAGIALIMLGMLTSMAFLSTGRTALVTIPVLLVLFALKRLSARAAVAVLVGAAVLAAVAWSSAPYLRDRATAVWTETQNYLASNARNSSGERLAFYSYSLRFISEAPVIGHGTGTITKLFAEATAGKTGAAGSATTNPHNQSLAVAIQIGLVGALALWAMWIAHFMLFRAPGLVQWIGLVVVTQNIVGSLFNSHLFDFLQGWIYVFGVGVAGGLALRERRSRVAIAMPHEAPREMAPRL